ncbi:hypothetical protein [Falsiroseomonas sp. HW251]|uniref:hypothetical protein n=1 Tax=Falsiroseomonas sp. HW251 TaxID=3390998 RepID=UPI003D310CB7
MIQNLFAATNLGITAFAVVVFAVLMAGYYVGVALGARRGPRASASEADNVSPVVTGMLGLLAFSLALTLNMAQGRFDARRAAALAESNAIGTAWLRAKAIGHPRGEAIARGFENYLRLRLDYVQAGPRQAGLTDIADRTNAAQGLIWGHVAAIVRERSDPVAAALQASVNDAFDSSTTQRWAFADPMPEEILLLLLAMSVVSISALGYQISLRARWLPFASAMLIAMWTATIALTVDLSQPRFGSIGLDPRVYQWTLNGFAGGVTIPPAP